MGLDSNSPAAQQTPSPGVDFDAVGIFWTALAAVWTGIVISGMVFLFMKRDMPFLRVRSLSLSFGAVILLHLYWLAVQLGYVYGALMPAAVEYWIMSIYVPFGIALFQASNTQLLHVSKAQKKFVRHESISSIRPRPEPAKPSFLRIHRKLDYPTRMLLYVSIGMMFQLFLTTIMFLVSRKFHDGFGIAGTEVTGTDAERKAQQSKGWEWWPSVFWQVFWAWIFAPIILWKARRIEDTHGWRLQTMACCLAGLPASPMWLIALYVPQMALVNEYFIPPQWIAVSIVVLEIFTIILPCFQTLRHQALQQETLDSIARWESRNKTKPVDDSVSDSWKSLAGMGKAGSVYSSSDSVLVIGALEYVLEKNPEPLRQFSALKDFSGENIAFLMSVAEWKASLPLAARDDASDKSGRNIARELVRQKFNHALRIYNDYISPRGAEFPINIASAELRRLEVVFEDAAHIMFDTKEVVNPICPFEMVETSSSSELTAVGSGSSSVEKDERKTPSTDGVLFWGEIPDTFNATVFDEVEKSIKYLVLTNTWPKFVKERRGSSETLRSEDC